MPRKTIYISPNQYLCPKCNRIYLNVKASESNSDGWTEEHIIPLGLGNKDFMLTLCKTCNNGFSQRFESEFLRRPEVRFGQLKAQNFGRRVSKPNIGIEAKVLTLGKESIRSVEIHNGAVVGKTRLLPIGSTQKYINPNLGSGFVLSEELSRFSVENDRTSVLEAIKIGFEQIFWHMGIMANKLEVVDFIRKILDSRNQEEFHSFFSEESSRALQSLSFMVFPDPMRTVAGDYAEMRICLKSFNALLVDEIVIRANFSHARQERPTKTHEFRVTIVSKSKKSPLLIIRYDLYGTCFGFVKIPITNEDLKLLGSGFQICDWIHWESGTHQVVMSLDKKMY